MSYVKKQLIRNEAINAIGNDYPDANLFDKHFNEAYNKTDAIDEVIKIMQGLLAEYAKSTAKTKVGKAGRFFALIGSKILPFVKFIKIKK
jgi:hypothetical protein